MIRAALEPLAWLFTIALVVGVPCALFGKPLPVERAEEVRACVRGGRLR